MIELQLGETVDITIRGARVGYRHSYNETTFMIPAWGKESNSYLTLHNDTPNVDVRRVTPVDGEPQPGDIWVDATGERYFTYSQRNNGVAFCSVTEGNFRSWLHLHAGSCGPITLEYRPEPVAADGRRIDTEADDYTEPSDQGRPEPPIEAVAAAILTPDAEVKA